MAPVDFFQCGVPAPAEPHVASKCHQRTHAPTPQVDCSFIFSTGVNGAKVGHAVLFQPRNAVASAAARSAMSAAQSKTTDMMHDAAARSITPWHDAKRYGTKRNAAVRRTSPWHDAQRCRTKNNAAARRTMPQHPFAWQNGKKHQQQRSGDVNDDCRTNFLPSKKENN